MRPQVIAHCSAILLVLNLAPAVSPADQPDSSWRIADNPHAALVSGTYVGHWRDGPPLVETVQMVTPDMITLQRHNYASSPVTLRLVAPGVFRDRDGNLLTLVSATRLIWTDRQGQTTVTYDRAD
ncbi:hypothetical protein [Antarctobacter sp.]|uniref:hypothetical protein n=1 Tax=Antarctobacter sp. TaxID=1872577 RepID=UPI002B271864|nr:hypothetical protein [Antarctobacter sp.]